MCVHACNPVTTVLLCSKCIPKLVFLGTRVNCWLEEAVFSPLPLPLHHAHYDAPRMHDALSMLAHFHPVVPQLGTTQTPHPSHVGLEASILMQS